MHAGQIINTCTVRTFSCVRGTYVFFYTPNASFVRAKLARKSDCSFNKRFVNVTNCSIFFASMSLCVGCLYCEEAR